MKYTTIVFDCDGTLLDTSTDLFNRIITNAWFVFAGNRCDLTIAVRPKVPAIENNISLLDKIDRLKKFICSSSDTYELIDITPSSDIFSTLIKLTPFCIFLTLGVVPLVINWVRSLNLHCSQEYKKR